MDQKLRDGLWSDNGFFQLVNAWQEPDGQRQGFIFELQAVQEETSGHAPVSSTPRSGGAWCGSA